MSDRFGTTSGRDFEATHDAEPYSLDPEGQASRRPQTPSREQPFGPGTRRRLVLGSLAVLAALGVVVYALVEALAWSPAPGRNGDMLGQDSGESYLQYQQRAAESLAGAPADEDVYALITFARPLEAAEAGVETEHLDRVNAMVVGMAAPYPLPEPVAGATRADVYTAQLGMIARQLSGIGDVPVPYQLTAVVARDDGETLRALAHAERVATVETLPPDAAWGWFGVSPVEVPGIDQMAVAVPPVRQPASAR
ncbi:hypothetical protein [Corynebacterium guangdongense]|uniref:DUF4439 domain-containing protein n=1 Tax=Corynebacterium guangdongense TaxID=1783348 RepID=A0ABU1ZXQ9_9CORY|nr:hypothetical protein [Corynebacterium guangdongense]MDR7329719.1 hypothetical protein [Corynebacterium guangdongense]WJZ18283.1 hypothetical protein CGUA_08610 [Corynebacterium guangdongense]